MKTSSGEMEKERVGEPASPEFNFLAAVSQECRVYPLCATLRSSVLWRKHHPSELLWG